MIWLFKGFILFNSLNCYHKVWSIIRPDLKWIRICSFSSTSIDLIILFNFTFSIVSMLISVPLNKFTIEALDCKDREDAVFISVATIVFSTSVNALSNAVSFKLLTLLHCMIPLFNRCLHLQTIVLCWLLYQVTLVYLLPHSRQVMRPLNAYFELYLVPLVQ